MKLYHVKFFIFAVSLAVISVIKEVSPNLKTNLETLSTFCGFLSGWYLYDILKYDVLGFDYNKKKKE